MDSQLLKIATLNLCLGLKYKKDLVKNYLYSEEIDILAVQETEIEKDFNCDLLSIKGFKYEYEENSFKKRVGFYIKNCIKYERKRELEGTDSHLIVIDVDNAKHDNKRIINLYRSFNPILETAKDLFLKQLNLIKTAFTNGCVILGDFNLDYKMRHDINYPRANYFNLFDDVLGDLNLMQLVDFPTWSRLVGLSWRTSVLDHKCTLY